MSQAQTNIVEDGLCTPEGVRRGPWQCFGAGSMVALMLVLTVLPGAAVFASPEAVGHISVLLQEAVRTKPDRDPREPRVGVVEHQQAVALLCVVRVRDAMTLADGSRDRAPSRACVIDHHTRSECFAAGVWLSGTPPPMG